MPVPLPPFKIPLTLEEVNADLDHVELRLDFDWLYNGRLLLHCAQLRENAADYCKDLITAVAQSPEHQAVLDAVAFRALWLYVQLTVEPRTHRRAPILASAAVALYGRP